MASLIQLITTGAPAALTFIKGYLASPVIGGTPSSSKFSVLPGQKLVDGILIEPEHYLERERADVSTQMILSVSGNKQYISDNIAIQPRTWEISGYIPAEIWEITALFAPSLKKKKAKLQKIYRDRKLTWFKTRECEIVQVAIESIEFETRASVANKQPISITLKEIKVLTASYPSSDTVTGGSSLPASTPLPNPYALSGVPASSGAAATSALPWDTSLEALGLKP